MRNASIFTSIILGALIVGCGGDGGSNGSTLVGSCHIDADEFSGARCSNFYEGYYSVNPSSTNLAELTDQCENLNAGAFSTQSCAARNGTAEEVGSCLFDNEDGEAATEDIAYPSDFVNCEASTVADLEESCTGDLGSWTLGAKCR